MANDITGKLAYNQGADIEQRLEHIEKLITNLNNKFPEKDSSKEKASKEIVAASLGFAGFKLGGILGAKLGLLTDLLSAGFKYGFDGIEELARFSVGLQKNLTNENKYFKVSFKWTLIGGAISGIVGAIGGAFIGWHRGDRLDKSSDLLTHPIESIKKLLKKEIPDTNKKNSEKEHELIAQPLHRNDIPQVKIYTNDSENNRIISNTSLSK